MSYVSGKIDHEGAVIHVAVEISRQLQQLIRAEGKMPPGPVYGRALIDTGAAISGFSPRVFQQLGMSPVSKIKISTPSTSGAQLHECDLYDVSLSIVAEGRLNAFSDCRVAETNCFLPHEGMFALIGRDILNQCFFQYRGNERTFTLALAK